MLKPLISCATALLLACVMTSVGLGDTPGANVGDSCQSNNDCDSSAGQHCVDNKCVVPGGGSHSNQPGARSDYRTCRIPCIAQRQQCINDCGPGPDHINNPNWYNCRHSCREQAEECLDKCLSDSDDN
jgi:hypothetical protein